MIRAPRQWELAVLVGLRGTATRIQRRDGAASALTCPGAFPSVPFSFFQQESRMSADDRIKLEPGWKEALREEFDKPYMRELSEFLRAEKAAGKVIYPPGPMIFNALNSTPLDQVKVVVIGQDPYHGPGQAHGLCFSVQPGVPAPPSLVNIFKELKRDLNIDIPEHGYLQSWAEQGVLLLNTSLTVQQASAGSHADKGWQPFTDKVIEVVNARPGNLVFLLWGAHAQSKQKLIDSTRHLVLKSAHPSPLSAYRGFLGNGHFSRTNKYLEQCGLTPIDWRLPPLQV
jgi:uracil-DNA glycosylase